MKRRSPSSRKAGIEILEYWGGVCHYSSPSSRKAGIEILVLVELLKNNPSPSSRKAGIEIIIEDRQTQNSEVAFLTEGGD